MRATQVIVDLAALRHNLAQARAAAPTGAKRRVFSCDRRSRRPITEAMPAPICNAGSSGPSENPPPMASAQVTNFPITVRNGTYPS